MSRKLELLHPALQKIAAQLVRDCAARGLPLRITETRRTQAEQDALYRQGRSAPGKIVTNARYPNSAHCWGVAFDFCRDRRGHEYDDADGFFAQVAALAKPYGLTWGGDWVGHADKPHLELTRFMPGSSAAWLIRSYGCPENFFNSWEEEEGMRYRTIGELPAAFAPTIRKLMARGVVLGDGNEDHAARVIDLSEDMVRVLVYLDRAGVFETRAAEEAPE